MNLVKINISDRQETISTFADCFLTNGRRVGLLSFVIHKDSKKKINSIFKRGLSVSIEGSHEYTDYVWKKYYNVYYIPKENNLIHVIFMKKGIESYQTKDYNDFYTIYLNDSTVSIVDRKEDIIFSQEFLDKAYNIILNMNMSIPFLPEWTETIVRDSYRNISKFTDYCENTTDELYEKFGFRELFFFEDSNIKFKLQDKVVKNIQNGVFYIDDKRFESSDKFNSVHNTLEYQEAFSDLLINKAFDMFTPIFDPSKEEISDTVKNFFDAASYYSSGFKVYPAQQNVVQASVKHLDSNRNILVSGAMGSGKTVLGISIASCHARKTNFNTFVMSPPSITLNWKLEIESVNPLAKVYIVEDIGDLLSVIDKIKYNNKFHKEYSNWVIMSYNTAKSDYELRPAVIWNKKNNCYVCPHCYKALWHNNEFNLDNTINGVYTGNDLTFTKITPHNRFHIKEIKPENYASMYQKACGHSLWEAASKDNVGDWVKITGLGWVNRKRIKTLRSNLERSIGNLPTYSRQTLKANIEKKIKLIDEYTIKNSTLKLPKRYSIAKYIKKRLKNFFDYGIFDEVHELSGDSQQGNAFAAISKSVWKGIFLTGTLSNGYASGLFNFLFRTQPNKMLDEGFKYTDVKKFNDRYGVLMEETKVEIPEDVTVNRYSWNYRHTKNTKKYMPGISPLLYTDFLIGNTVFISKKDIKSDLCKYTEIPVAVKMNEDQLRVYDEVMTVTARDIKNSRNRAETRNAIFKSSMFLDQPFGIDLQREDGTFIELPENTLLAKEDELINICTRHKENGEKILVYVEWTGKLDIVNKLVNRLSEAGINALGMDNNIKINEREKWLKTKASEGEIDAIILNPTLVGTGLNLLDYTTIVFYEVSSKAITIRQASQRSNRINQTKPVSVYFLYYENTVQESELALVSQKIRAAKAIEGDFSETALQEIGDDTDILAKMANAIANNENIKISMDDFEVDTEDNVEVNNFIEEENKTCFADREIYNFYYPEYIKKTRSKKKVVTPEYTFIDIA